MQVTKWTVSEVVANLEAATQDLERVLELNKNDATRKLLHDVRKMHALENFRGKKRKSKNDASLVAHSPTAAADTSEEVEAPWMKKAATAKEPVPRRSRWY